MDKTYIEKNGIVERYVLGALSVEETAAFELCLLEHADLADDVERVRSRQDDDRGARSDRRHTSDAVRHVPTTTRWLPSAKIVAATSVAVAALTAMTALLIESRPSAGPDLFDDADLSAVATEIRLDRLRSGEVPVIAQAPHEALLLRAVVTRAGIAYDVRIAGVDHPFEWSRTGLYADETPTIRVVARDLPFGTYELSATAEGQSEPAVSHRFELVAAE